MATSLAYAAVQAHAIGKAAVQRFKLLQKVAFATHSTASFLSVTQKLSEQLLITPVPADETSC